MHWVVNRCAEMEVGGKIQSAGNGRGGFREQYTQPYETALGSDQEVHVSLFMVSTRAKREEERKREKESAMAELYMKNPVMVFWYLRFQYHGVSHNFF